MGNQVSNRQKLRRGLLLAVLVCGPRLMAADPVYITKPIDVPAPAPGWDNFTVLDPTAFKQRGGFVPAKELSMILNQALEMRYPVLADTPQWIRFQMKYSIDGTIDFSRQGLDAEGGKLKQPISSDSFSASVNSLRGPRLATKADIVAWIAALHKYDAWADIARSKDIDNVVKEIGRSPRYIFTFVVKEHIPYLRVTIVTTVDSVLRREPLGFKGGVESWDFQRNEVHLFEFFMSKIKGLQEKMAAEQKADPFK